MKVLFIARHFTYFRNFESVIGVLAERGHQVHLATDRDDTQGGEEIVARLASRWPGVTYGVAPIREWGRYRRVAGALRLGLDYLRYSDPRFESMPKIRQRAYDRTPAFVLALARLPCRRLVTAALERIEEAVPPQAGVDAFVRAHAPDLLIVTPLIELGSPQLDYVRAAARLGVRTALAVWSWDHLSSKALIRVRPDRVLVWNDVQREEAARFHGIAPEHVIVTGAQCFDQWFDRAPARPRAALCRHAGLPDDSPYVLYVCSALFRGSPPEAGFVARWIEAIRAAGDARLRAMHILVRPHPQRPEDWSAVTGMEGVTVWGSNPIDPAARADYFDSMFHSTAVVGLNTSALVEAAIVDRPVYTILLPEFRENQEGTFHFQHLLTVGDGFLNAARTLEEHVAQLAKLVDGRAPRRNRAFVERFIRPHGMDVPATGVFADAVEELGRVAPAPAPARAWVVLLRPLVYALVLAGRLPVLERLYWNPNKFRQHAHRIPAET